MFSIEPYSATHPINRLEKDGSLRQEWERCRVLGITAKDGEPKYLIETYDLGDRYLELVDSVRTTH